MADEAENEQEQGKQEGTPPAKGKKKLLLVIVALVVVLLGGGGVTAMLLMKKKETKVDELAADMAAEEGPTGQLEGSGDELELEEGEEALGAIVPFDTFLVNLSGGKYVRVQVQVEFETLDIPSRFYTRMVPMRDGIISTLTQLTAEDLETPKGKENLKNKIKTLMNDLLRREEVKRVYFTQFVIQ